ncbi:MAG TPA: cytochrome P450 [Solimonas sp.]|nr:cytochrome P450 [Solimonas sp.]
MSQSVAAQKSLPDLPGPRGWPLLGNLPQIRPAQMHQQLERWAGRYGSLYRIRFGSKPLLVISDIEICRRVMRERPANFGRFPAFDRIISDMGLTSLFSAEGETWQRQRRVFMRALNIHHMAPFLPKLDVITQRLQGLWRRAAETGKPVAVLDDVMRYTLDVTTRFAFGYDANALETHEDPIQKHLSRILPMVSRRARIPFPYWHYIKLAADRQLDADLEGVRGYVEGLIADARARIAADPALQEKPTNLIEALLVTRDEDGSVFSDNDIFSNALGTLVAGEDTTAMTLAWMMYFLAGNPQAQERLHAEVVAGGAEYPFLEAVMNETFRLKPVAPVFFLHANVDVELGGCAVPKGTDLVLVTRPGAWDEAEFPGGREFRPERWMEPQANYVTRAPLPFGHGPRLCPGRNLAQLEIRTVAAMLARHFRIRLADARPVIENFAFTMAPKDLGIVFEAR